MPKLRIALLLLAICLAGTACAGKRSPSQQLAGSWIFDYEATAAEPQMREWLADPAFAQEFETYMKDLRVAFDFERKVVTAVFPDGGSEQANFEFISESTPDNSVILEIDGARAHFHITGDLMYWREQPADDVPPLIYKRLRD